MTLWNPLNVFSPGQASSSDEGPSASFDPSRIGDPLDAPSAGPAIGLGDARVGTVGVGDPRRNPIGFAPPETETPSRFRTEISFRRHNELPRASALPAEADDRTSTPWQSLDPVERDDATEHDVVGETLFDEVPEAEKSPGIFRREISFRRKKTAGDEPVAVEPELEDEPAEVVAEAEADEPEVVAEALADEPAADDQAADDVAVDEPVVAKAVPFYKREIGFGRKKDVPVAAAVATLAVDDVTDDVRDADEQADEPELAAEHVEPELVAEHDEPEAPAETAEEDAPVATEVFASDEPAADDPAVDDAVDAEPVAPAAVPFYKRELSFRRKKTVAEAAVVVAADEALEHEAPTEAEAPVDEPAVAWARSDEPAEEPSVADEAQGAADAPVDELETEPVAEVAAVHAVEPETTDDHSFTEPETEPVADEPATAEAAVFAGDVAHEAVTEAADAELPEDAVVHEEPVAAVEHDTSEPVAAVEHDTSGPDTAEHDSLTHDPVAVDPDAVALVAVAEADAVLDASATGEAPAEDLPVDEVDGTDAGETPAEETPESGGRFGARKQKAPRQKRSGGPKGRRAVGLKIGASQIAAAVVSETEAGHELVQVARRSLAAGIVVDGEVRDEGALASAVKAFFDEEKLPKTDVHIGLSSNRIGVRTLDIDGVEDESRFDNAVRFKAHEVLPVALSESVLDYRVLEERVGEDGQATRRVLLVVAPRDQVEPYQRVAIQAGIKLTAIDLEALGLLRAFVEPGSGVPAPDDTATVVIAMGHESSTLLVAGGGSCEFTRVFDWGGGALEEAIASSLEVRPAEAATILRHLSLSGPGRAYEGLNDETRAKATDAVRQRLTPFARELVNSLQFYQTQAESLGIGGILVTGGTSHLEGLDDALHQMIGVDVSVGNPLARVVRVAEIDPATEATIGSLAVPIGLAIEDLATRGINLLPKGTGSKRVASRSTLLSIGVPVAAAIPLAALSFMYLGAHNKAVDNRGQLDAVRAEIAALPPAKAPVIDASVVGNEAARATAVAQVLGGRLAWDAVFRDLARVLPENVWLSTLQLTQPASAANLADGTTAAAPSPLPGQSAANPTAVSIDGFTYTQPDVARLLARLATLPSLQRVTLTSSQSQLVGSKTVVHFVIVADLSSTGGAS